MPLFSKTLTYALVAAVANGIAASQSGTANTALTLNGSLVTGGVATLDSGGAARRVIITSAGNDSGITFTLKGTDRYGRPQSEVLTGATATNSAQSVKDYATITSTVPSGNTASTVTAGTNGVGSSAPIILDWVPNGNAIGCSTLVTGTVNYTIQEARDDYAPAWDMVANNPNWFSDPTFNGSTTSTAGNIQGPFTMVRLLINSGTGTVQAKFLTPFIGGGIA